MKDDNLYDIFHIFSRAIVVFAIIVLVIGLFIRFNQSKPVIQSFITNQKPTIMPVNQSFTEAISTSAAGLNLKGPFMCDFSSPSTTVSASVKDNNVFGQIKEQSKTTSILLKGDCIYFWKNLSAEGEKICGVSPFISIFGQMPIANLLGNSQLLSLAGGFGINQSMLPIDIKMIPSILDSCTKKEISNESVFNLPKKVVFQEKKL